MVQLVSGLSYRTQQVCSQWLWAGIVVERGVSTSLLITCGDTFDLYRVICPVDHLRGNQIRGCLWGLCPVWKGYWLGGFVVVSYVCFLRSVPLHVHVCILLLNRCLTLSSHLYSYSSHTPFYPAIALLWHNEVNPKCQTPFYRSIPATIYPSILPEEEEGRKGSCESACVRSGVYCS